MKYFQTEAYVHTSVNAVKQKGRITGRGTMEGTKIAKPNLVCMASQSNVAVTCMPAKDYDPIHYIYKSHLKQQTLNTVGFRTNVQHYSTLSNCINILS